MSDKDPKTISEKIMSLKSGVDAHAGEIVVANVDYVMVNDVTGPLAFQEFEGLECEPMREKIRPDTGPFRAEQGYRLGPTGQGDA